MQDRPILAGIQVPPRPLRVVVIQCTLRLTFRARPRRLRLVPQRHVDLSLFQPQLHLLHSPRNRNSQNLLVQLIVLHGAPFSKEKAPSYPLDGKKPNLEDGTRSGKRRRALLGSNPTRDTRVEDVPKALAPWEPAALRAFLFYPISPLDIRVMPQKIREPPQTPALPATQNPEFP